MNKIFPKKIVEFKHYILLNASFNNQIGLLNGKAAVVLLFSLLEENIDPESKGIAISFLNEILTRINMTTPITYGEGVTGIHSLLVYLVQKGTIDLNVNEALEEIEPYIYKLINTGDSVEANICSGLSGLGLYILYRYFPFCISDISLTSQATKYFDTILENIKIVFEEKNHFSDYTIFSGISGVFLFVENLVSLKIYQKNDVKINFIMNNLLFQIKNILESEIFDWSHIHIYYSAFKCEWETISSLKRELLIKFRNYLDEAIHHVHSVNFYDASFLALLLKIIGVNFKIEEAITLSNLIVEKIFKHLADKEINELFPYDPQKQCVPVGLKNGICGTLIPLISLKEEDYDWLRIFGAI